jgi:hypothetical protein
MTTLLESVFHRLSQLSADDQDRYAKQLMDELDGDATWDRLFAQTSDAQWERMTVDAKDDARTNGRMTLSEMSDLL